LGALIAPDLVKNEMTVRDLFKEGIYALMVFCIRSTECRHYRKSFLESLVLLDLVVLHLIAEMNKPRA
jgi:hypothetical protein